MDNEDIKTSDVITFPNSQKNIQHRIEVAYEKQNFLIDEIRPAKEILLNFSNALEANAIYLNNYDMEELNPVIENLVQITAKIRYWLE
ncbi:MAG: hypothetical protein N0E54_13695 [Candidatus Thiodiazotropha taylori]|nr:hypothetical protein [Candidatus Thiodiazotropha endolucinida]MCW4229786.1 hypothetical protein [Candidatus Thiodiazotropha taylori]